MIRPLTCVCMLLAGASGLYLYQAKHRAQVLDREIARTAKQAEEARARITMLQAEWALLQDPERLTELANRHLALQKLAPSQYVSLAELASRLPAPLPPGPPALPEETAPVMSLPLVQTPAAPVVPPRGPMMAAASRPQAQQAAPAQPVPAPAAPSVAPLAAPVMLAAARPMAAVPAPRTRAADATLPAPPPAAPAVPAAPRVASQTVLASATAAAAPVLPPPVPPAPSAFAHAPAPRPVFAPVVQVAATPVTVRHAEPVRPPVPYAAPQAMLVSAAPMQASPSAVAPAPRLDPAIPTVSSALGMARTALAAPVPVASANAAPNRVR